MGVSGRRGCLLASALALYFALGSFQCAFNLNGKQPYRRNTAQLISQFALTSDEEQKECVRAHRFANVPTAIIDRRVLAAGLAGGLQMIAPVAHAEGSRSLAVVPLLDYEAASLAMSAALQKARASNWSVTVVVSDAGGVPLAVSRLDTYPASLEIAMGKARSAAMFRKETEILERIVNSREGSGRSALLSAGFVIMGGGVPVIIDGTCIGSIGVSGVKPDEDAVVAKAGVEALLASFGKARTP